MTNTINIQSIVGLGPVARWHSVSELESVGRALLMLKRGEDLRTDRVEAAKLAIANGEYDGMKLNAALDRLLNDMSV